MLTNASRAMQAEENLLADNAADCGLEMKAALDRAIQAVPGRDVRLSAEIEELFGDMEQDLEAARAKLREIDGLLAFYGRDFL